MISRRTAMGILWASASAKRNAHAQDTLTQYTVKIRAHRTAFNDAVPGPLQLKLDISPKRERN